MLPSIGDWLSASWADYRRRWKALMAVLALGGLATAAGVFLPLIPAGILSVVGIGSPWAIWGAAGFLSLLAGLGLSTWTQAAAIRAAAEDQRAGAALSAGWRQTPAFAWVLSLATLAAGGGFVLFVVPGLILGVLLFFSPFYQMDGETGGLDAVELSFARVRPVFGAVSARLAVAGLVAWLPSWIPYVGWLIGPLWAPFALVAFSRLARDLKTLSPAPERPSLRAAVWALSLVFVGATFALSLSAVRASAALYESYASGKLEFKAPDAATAQSLLATLQGQATEEDRARSLTYAISLSSAAAATPP